MCKVIDAGFGKWVKVENKPCESKPVLVTLTLPNGTLVTEMYYNAGRNIYEWLFTPPEELADLLINVVAWMDLPEAYKA